ncbi:alpha/beta fold hydrolase [Sphaerochaeta globosa]|uniref:Alpha/beta hydrolase fold protein n=1 Tax=Sphaerochaeta globosa (strain ATCC BAA-1886 / DSM 22777 / Buddy) TaxID=158189 RepID=F0RYM9_SPHGB|nr:alpha/beta fold hydrolase [Sphaerochaeta globosa]ADY12872.1 alpha/beta hydrolase fold protein [Sphaerochaeta globosa str. Buddy]
MENVLIPSFDKFFLSCNLYRSDKPKAVVQIIHGAAEYKARYQEVATFLQNEGYCVLVSDQRGHGESTDAHFVRGFLPSVEVLVQDQWYITQFLKEQYPVLPIHLLGHSFGSNVARLYLASHDEQLASLVMTGSPCYVPGISLGMKLVKLLMVFLSPNGYGFISGKLTTSPSLKWVCSDPSVVEERRIDPYRKNFRYQLASVYTIFDSVKKLHAWPLYEAKNRSLPILCICGAEDPVPGYSKGLADTQASLKRIGYETFYSKVYAGMRHEVLMEKEKELVFSLIAQFLEKGKLG